MEVGMNNDTPKTWGEMTEAEKGALLLAHHEGKVIQTRAPDETSWVDIEPSFDGTTLAYRVRPEHAHLPLEVGRKYVATNSTEWECIFVRDGNAWLTWGNGPAYVWTAETGESLSMNKDYDITGLEE